MQPHLKLAFLALLVLSGTALPLVQAQEAAATGVIFEDVRIFDGTGAGLSGPRNPYPGRLGVVQEGALADLLLVDGNPLADLSLVADPGRNFLVIMKGGKVYKNSLQ